ncbi:MAG: hypothetical protein IJJ28_05925, partial [Lentisphaeria bacterium]|nr:hypothetical protein [Lentisphaeria bacterium]
LSPFLRPRAFAATLGQYPNWCFVAALLLPCGVPALRAPRRLLIAVPLLAGVLLQHSSEVKNPVMQYGFELSALVLAAAVAAAGALLLRRDEAGKYALRAGLRTMMATTLLCALGWGRLPRGLYSARAILDRPDATEVVAALRRLSADGERVLSTKRLRLYHMFDRSVGAPDDPLVPGDTVILDLDDALESAGMLRRRIIADERAMPVYSTNFYGRHFAVWKIAPPGTPRPGLPFLRRCGEREFAALGEALPQDDPAFGARLVRTAAGGALLLLRVNDAVAYDVAIDLRMRQAGKNVHRRLRFGDGVYPAWCAKPGEVYTVALPGVFPEAVRLRLLRCD